MSSCFVERDSIPGKAEAILRNKGLILNPAFALVSINMIPLSRDLASPSSIETCLFSTRSVLFPTKTIITSLPRSARTSSTHLLVLRNDCRFFQSFSASLINTYHNGKTNINLKECIIINLK
uniref:Uncharacterized protein n=1 Tax=Medicago truncatula TaxID=3880 RepID=I3SMF7_MEDTR|nr:unknown [Medicago truncatula]